MNIDDKKWPGVDPFDYKEIVTKCPKCGIELKGVCSYYCPQTTCPIFPKAIC